MLRILVLTPDFPPATGGIQTLIHGLLRHASRLHPRVVTLPASQDREFDRGDPLDIKRVARHVRSRKSAVATLNLHGLLEVGRFRPSVILSVHIVTSPAAWVAQRTLSIPMIQYVHADELRTRPYLAAFALRRAAASVAVSAHSASQAVAAGAKPERIEIISPGVEIPPSSDRGRVCAAEPPTILTVARLTDRFKGHDVLIRALPTIQASVPHARWVVVGDGPLRIELERRVAERRLEGSVTFAGHVSDAERDSWYARADVFAMPSRLPPTGRGGEGFGIAFLEASAHGLPIVAGNVAGALDAVEDGCTGLLVEPTDPAEVAAAITNLLADPERARRLGRAGRERAQQFAWPVVAGRLEDLVFRVSGQRAPP
jgi:phosphatidylinositol alpha-1,6-mannosyltransferase